MSPRDDHFTMTEDDAGRFDRAHAESYDDPREPEFDAKEDGWMGGWS